MWTIVGKTESVIFRSFTSHHQNVGLSVSLLRWHIQWSVDVTSHDFCVNITGLAAEGYQEGFDLQVTDRYIPFVISLYAVCFVSSP